MEVVQKIKKILYTTIGIDQTEFVIYNRHFFSDSRIKRVFYNTNGDITLENYEKIKEGVLSYVSSMQMQKYEYRYSKCVDKPTLYASTYACMIKGYLGALEETDKKGWIEYFNSFQREDGLFYDKNIYNQYYDNGEGWGAHHLIPQLLIAYERLGGTPAHELLYLNSYCNENALHSWLDNLNLSKAWAASNGIMNVGTALQYARDRMNMDVSRSIEILEDWLIKNVRTEYPVWFSGELNSKKNLYEAVRGAYHIYPILLRDGIEIPGFKKLISLIPKLQNKWGGFDFPVWSSACTDIDAVDPLIRSIKMSHKSNQEVDHCLRKAFKNAVFNQNSDGGFVFSRQNIIHKYGECKNLLSKPQESNMLGTWFRMLCILEILDYFKIREFDGLEISGYELELSKR